MLQLTFYTMALQKSGNRSITNKGAAGSLVTTPFHSLLFFTEMHFDALTKKKSYY